MTRHRSTGKRVVALVASVIAALGLGLGFASPAAATPPTYVISPTSGSVTGGTQVVIDGTSAGSFSCVFFGGAIGTIVNSTTDSVTVLTPSHGAGTVDVLLSTTCPRRLTPRSPLVDVTLASAFTYYDDTPQPWFQSIGRPSADALCPAGWNPSWAEWPNGHTGGFVCNRNYVWSGSDWAIRTLRPSTY